MATITGLTAERMLAIEASSIVDGDVVAGNLILQKHDGTPINAGSVIGPTGSTGATGPGVPNGGTTGQSLVKNSNTNQDTIWSTIAAPTVPIGITLPASPANGDEAILVDSLTVPTYAWRFRYVSGISDTYKWLFIGGVPLQSQVLGSTAQGAGSGQADLGGGVPAITLPRAGIWDIEFGAGSYPNNGEARIFLVVNGVTLSTLFENAAGGSSYSRIRHTAVAANHVAKHQYLNSASASASFYDRIISATPVRLV